MIIKTLFEKLVSCAALVSFFSMCLNPLNNPISADNYPVQNDNYYNSNETDNCEQYSSCEPVCCESSCDWGTWGTLALAAAIGAGTGAAVAYGNRHNGHHGDQGATGPGLPGPTGPTGPTGVPFPLDVIDTVSFSMFVQFTTGIDGGVTFTPFVTQPDGTTTIGASEVHSAPAFFLLIIGDVPAQFGSYTFGVQVEAGNLAGAFFTLSGTVSAAGTNTEVGFVTVPLTGGSEAQFSSHFVYDRPFIPNPP